LKKKEGEDWPNLLFAVVILAFFVTFCEAPKTLTLFALRITDGSKGCCRWNICRLGYYSGIKNILNILKYSSLLLNQSRKLANISEHIIKNVILKIVLT
jgi:hypothetical protein